MNLLSILDDNALREIVQVQYTSWFAKDEDEDEQEDEDGNTIIVELVSRVHKLRPVAFAEANECRRVCFPERLVCNGKSGTSTKYII